MFEPQGWHWGTWLVDHGEDRLTVGLDDLSVFFQTWWFYESVTVFELDLLLSWYGIIQDTWFCLLQHVLVRRLCWMPGKQEPGREPWLGFALCSSWCCLFYQIPTGNKSILPHFCLGSVRAMQILFCQMRKGWKVQKLHHLWMAAGIQIKILIIR